MSTASSRHDLPVLNHAISCISPDELVCNARMQRFEPNPHDSALASLDGEGWSHSAAGSPTYSIDEFMSVSSPLLHPSEEQFGYQTTRLDDDDDQDLKLLPACPSPARLVQVENPSGPLSMSGLSSARVEAPSFLPYNFDVPAHLFTKQSSTSNPSPSPQHEDEVEYLGSSFKPLQSVPLREFQIPTPPASPETNRRPMTSPSSKARGRARVSRRTERRSPTKQPPLSQEPEPKEAEDHRSEPSTTEMTRSPVKTGWKKIMKGIDTNDAKLQKNKWWWFLLAEKNRLVQTPPAATNEADDLEKARGLGVDASSSSAPIIGSHLRSLPDSPTAGVTMTPVSPSSGQCPSSALSTQMDYLSISSPLHDADQRSRSSRPHEESTCKDTDDDDDDSDAEWTPPTKSDTSEPFSSSAGRKRTYRRTSTPAFEKAQASPDAQRAAMDSPPKRRKMRPDEAKSRWTGVVPSAADNNAVSLDDPDIKKLPPRSRLKGLIAWMKANADAQQLGPKLPGSNLEKSE